MKTRLERRGLFGPHVHLLVAEGTRLIQIGYTGKRRRRGWGVCSDANYPDETIGGLRTTVSELKSEGYVEVDWIDEPGLDEMIAELQSAPIDM